MLLSSADPFDVAVIGAGVVGCAIARRCVLDGARVAIVEKAADVLDGASKGNSGLLHTGFDAPTGSLEQAYIADGYQEYLAIHAELGLPLLKTGAMVLAWNDEEASRLDGLMTKAHANGITDVAPLTRGQILALEPNLSGHVHAGFAVPGEFVIDPWSTPHAYIQQALANGAELLRDTEVLAGSFDGEQWRIRTSRGPLAARRIISSAGLYGDLVDERLLGRRSFSIKPRKGQFLVFDKVAAALVSAIILPVPTETTKGVVICRTIFGNLLVGPTAEEQESRDDASIDAETLQMLLAKGIEKIPALADCEVTAAYAGLRPATEQKDYRIINDRARHYISVGGIRSTGLSAALGIANHVATLVGEDAFQSAPIDNPVRPAPARLSAYDPRDWQDAGNGGIVCHCELVTRREIDQILSGPIPPASLAGLKRQTRVGMGRCQGFYCLGALSKITEGRFNAPIAGVMSTPSDAS